MIVALLVCALNASSCSFATNAVSGVEETYPSAAACEAARKNLENSRLDQRALRCVVNPTNLFIEKWPDDVVR
jgi:hypothetical protein